MTEIDAGTDDIVYEQKFTGEFECFFLLHFRKQCEEQPKIKIGVDVWQRSFIYI